MNRKPGGWIIGIVIGLTLVATQDAWAKGEWFQDWDMEDQVAQAQLILVGRVTNVSAMTVVRGGKVTSTLREYRFQPIRRLKGVFSRDELAMTSADLGIPEGDGSTGPPLQPGEFHLLLLGRTSEGFASVGARGSPFPDQQGPRLKGPEDPVVETARTLIRLTELSSRQARTALLVGQLDRSSGPAAVPLLQSLSRRAIWAAQTPRVARPLARLMRDPSPAVSGAAVSALERVLAADPLKTDDKALGVSAEALRHLLGSATVETATRQAALRAVGHLGGFGRRLPWTSELLTRQLDDARTYAECQAAAAALADLNNPQTAGRVLQALDRLPLDEQPPREQTFADAAVRLAGAGSAPVLMRRLARKEAAGESLLTEVSRLGTLKSRAAIPTLLGVAGMVAPDGGRREPEAGAGNGPPRPPIATARSSGGLLIPEQIALAQAFELIQDDRAVPLLAAWLHSPSVQLREAVVAALDAVDSEAAVAAVRLRLKTEPSLALKLRMAQMLGRHGIRDGYPFAIEHIADPGLTELAAEALGAIRDDRTGTELWTILETSHDRLWNAAALAGLAAVRDPRVKPRLREILGNAHHPLLAEAAAAAGILGDRDLLTVLKPLVSSRNAQVARAALRSIAKLTAGVKPDKAIRDAATAVLDVLSDPDADLELRLAALKTLRAMNEPRLLAALKALADQAELENSPLLRRVEEELIRAKARLGP